METNRAAIQTIALQLAENCSALWENREHVALSATYPSTLTDLARLDTRIDAQLDGLRTTGQAGRLCVKDALELQGTGEFFTAAVLAFEEANGKGLPLFLDALLNAPRESASAIRPMAVALDWIGMQQFTSAISWLSSQKSILAKAITMMAKAMRGIECRSSICEALETDCPLLIRSACWAAHRHRTTAALPLLENHLKNADAGLRATIAHSALSFRSSKAEDVLREAIASAVTSTVSEFSAEALFRSLSPRQALWAHGDLFPKGSASRVSIRAAGAAGIPELIPIVVEQLGNKGLRRLAGEVIFTFTGVDVGGFSEASTGSIANESVDELDDEIIAFEPDEGLVWPSQSTLEAWWHDHSTEFSPLTRYLDGEVVRPKTLKKFIGSGPQKRRTTAAELLMFSEGAFFDVLAPAFRQSQRLTMEKVWQ